MKLQIACIPGDGIGPEIVAQANKVLDQVAKKFGHEIERKEILMGGASIDVHGVPLTDEAIATEKAAEAEIPTPPPGTSSLRKSVRKQVC